MPRVVLDCRWLGLGGTGRLTELLARGLAELRPATTWVLWGSSATSSLAWPGSETVLTSVDPRAMFGQRSSPRVPRADLVLFMHQMRPLRPVPSVTVVLDTIPLRFSRSLIERIAKRAFLRTVRAISRRIVTISEYSRGCIERDLGVPAERLSVVRLPVDRQQVERVHELRRHVEVADTALYVGTFAPHKNTPRLIEAFGRTDFRRGGGRLLLVGGRPGEVGRLKDRLTERQRDYVDVRPRCSQDELDWLFARSRLLIQPSLEEGFGLPAWEALACGLPVCASDGGALPEVLDGRVKLFPATSTSAMTEAIDRCADDARAQGVRGARSAGDELVRSAPDLRQFAAQFEGIVDAVMAAADADLSRRRA